MKFDTPATNNPIDQLKVVGKPVDRIYGPRKTTGTAPYAYERHDAGGRQIVRTGLRDGEPVQDRFSGRADDGRHVRARDRVDALDEDAPALEERRVAGVELREARKAVRPGAA